VYCDGEKMDGKSFCCGFVGLGRVVLPSKSVKNSAVCGRPLIFGRVIVPKVGSPVVSMTVGEGRWLDKARVTALAVLAGVGMMFSPKFANARTDHVASSTLEEKSTDVTSLVIVGGAVLGGLALKKKIDERRESRDLEMRAKEQQELIQGGRAPSLDLRDIERKEKAEREMETMDADKDAAEDEDLMSDLRKRMEKIKGSQDKDDGSEDPNNRPGVDGRRDHSSRGNTGSATLEPPTDDKPRKRRPIRRPRSGTSDPRRPPQSRKTDENQEKGGTMPRNERDGDENVSKENLDMLKRMWDLSGDGEVTK